MFQLDGVTIQRGARNLIDDVRLDLVPGRLTAILGPNGAGKSTLVKAVTGEWLPSAGVVRLHGRDLKSFSAGQLARQRAVVPQNTALSFPFTVLGVVMLGTTVPGFGIETDTTHAMQSLREVGLTGFEQRNYTQLSGGERQRVQIARALCQLNSSGGSPGVAKALILDEPTSNLDPAHQAVVLAALRRQAAMDRTVAVVLHDLNLAAAWADVIVLMARGKVVATGLPRDVMTDEILTSAYGCTMRVNQTPHDDSVFVLPHHTKATMVAVGEIATSELQAV